MVLSGMLGCGCVRSRRGELRRIVNALRAYRLVCVVVLGDVRQSVGRYHENEMRIGIEYISNVHTFRRAKIRCTAIFTTYSHTYRHLEQTAERHTRASPAHRRRRRRRHRNARRPRARHQAAHRPCRTRRPAYTTCHAGTGSSGPAAEGHRRPTTAGRRSRAAPPVRSRSCAARPRASARASAVIPPTPAAILRLRSTLSPPGCDERAAKVGL